MPRLSTLTLLAACAAAPPAAPPATAELAIQVAAGADGAPTPLCGTHSGAPAVSWEPRAGFVSWLMWSEGPNGRRVHWMAWDAPASAGGLPAGTRPSQAPPLQGRNGAGHMGWWGACDLDDAPVLQIEAWHTPSPISAPPTIGPDALGARLARAARGQARLTVPVPPPQPAPAPPEPLSP